MCCSAQLLGADSVGGGVVCCVLFFFFTKEKYKNLFLWESVKFLPVAVVLGPSSLLFFLFFGVLYFGMSFLSARGPAGGGDELPFL